MTKDRRARVGAFCCRYLGILTPTPDELGVPRTVVILTIAYVSGRDTLQGSLFAAFLLIGMQEYSRSLEAWRLIIYGGLLIGVWTRNDAPGPNRGVSADRVELTPAEWADTRDLLLRAQTALHDLLAPDGYLLGWNQGAGLHPHMHVIPRFDDEPLSDRGLRSAINVPENRRPDPWAPGSGRALRSAR